MTVRPEWCKRIRNGDLFEIMSLGNMVDSIKWMKDNGYPIRPNATSDISGFIKWGNDRQFKVEKRCCNDMSVVDDLRITLVMRRTSNKWRPCSP